MSPPGGQRIYAAVLAAGKSERFGASKLLQPLHGRPLIASALTTAQAAVPGNVILVTGHDASAVADASDGLADEVVFNGDYESGIGTSIALAARTCRDAADALVIMLADQPLITPSHIEALVEHLDGRPDRIVATAYSGTLGAPTLFGRNFFDALARLEGDCGAKPVLLENDQVVDAVEFEPASIDIDTPADLSAAARC